MTHGFAAFFFAAIAIFPVRAHEAGRLPGPPDGLKPAKVQIVTVYTPQDAPFCADFSVSEGEVLAWLWRTWPVPGRYVANDLYSPCGVKATVTMKDGQTATLSLKSSGAGVLSLHDGRQLDLFGPPSWVDPMSGAYFNVD